MSNVDRHKNKYWGGIDTSGETTRWRKGYDPNAGCKKITLQCNMYGYARKMAMDMARRPNQILPRKGMYAYRPCVTQKRCRNPQPTYQRGISAIHMQNCVLTWKVRAHTRPSSTWKGASHRRKVMQWMHAIYNAISTNMQWNGYGYNGYGIQAKPNLA